MHLPSFKFWRLGLPLKVVELGLLLLLNFDLYSANFNLKFFVDGESIGYNYVSRLTPE